MTAIIGILVLIIGYGFLSLMVILPNETGWMTVLGAHGRALNSGIHLCPKWFTNVAKYTKTPLIFKFKVSSATTKNGFVKGYRDDTSEIERTDLDILLTLTTYFDHSNLFFTVANAPGNNAKKLGPAIEPFIQDIVRSVASEMPWPLFLGDKDNVSNYILSKIIPEYSYADIEKEISANGKSNIYSFGSSFKNGENKKKMMSKNPLVQFGLDTSRTTIKIEDINFSKASLANLLGLAEEERMKADAGVIANNLNVFKIREEGKAKAEASAELIEKEGKAKAEAKKLDAVANADFIEKEGKAKAEARKNMIAEIKDNPDLEYLRTLEQMAKGTSNTILYQIPKKFEEKIGQILGGGKPEDWFALLKDPKILEALQEALQKITDKK